MPLMLAKTGEENLIRKISGRDETKKYLEHLGFVAGGAVTVIAEYGGSVIVRVKGSRVAVSREMANKIYI